MKWSRVKNTRDDINPVITFSTDRGAASTVFYLGATTSTVVDTFEGAIAPRPDLSSSYLITFSPSPVETPLSEFFAINAVASDGPFSYITLAEGETSFNADTLTNNVIVFQQGPFEILARTREPFLLANTFLSTTPTTVLTDPNGDNIIQFVLAAPMIILGDVNGDGIGNFADIPSFIGILIDGGFQVEADFNQDEEVNFSDIPPFIQFLIDN